MRLCLGREDVSNGFEHSPSICIAYQVIRTPSFRFLYMISPILTEMERFPISTMISSF